MTVAEREVFRRFYASLKTSREFQAQMLELQRVVGRSSRHEVERMARAIRALNGPRPKKGK